MITKEHRVDLWLCFLVVLTAFNLAMLTLVLNGAHSYRVNLHACRDTLSAMQAAQRDSVGVTGFTIIP